MSYLHAILVNPPNPPGKVSNKDVMVDFAIQGEPDGPVLDLLAGVPLGEIAGLVHKMGGAPDGMSLR